MNSIEKKALETYKINLNYFSKEHAEVHKKITLLEQAIQNGSYIEKYALEYKNNYFDILELSSGNYLYNQDSNKHAKELAKTINHKKSDAVIEGFYNQHLTQLQVEQLEEKVDIRSPLFAAAKIIQYCNSVTSKNDEMKDIFKFIFCGIGLGLHLHEIEKKTKSSMVFIMEDNLELFRISLFSTNYKELSKKAKLFFSIMDSDSELKKVFDDFFTQGYTHNHYIKYALLSQGDIPKVKRIQNSIISSVYLTYPYSMQLLELLRAPEYLVEKYHFINLSKNHFSSSPLSNKPVLLIASGPSLGNNSKWLQENHEKFFIVAVLSSVKTLYSLNIKPDIVTHIDSLPVSARLFDGIDRENFFDKTIFIFSSVTSKNVFDLVPKEKIYCIESATHYKQGFRTVSAPSIGETTYAISLFLGVTQLYLLGLDLALDPETKSTHSKEHVFVKQVQENSIESEQYTSMQHTMFYTKGNFLQEVPTTPIYKISADAFNIISKHFLQKEQKVFNLNNGAYLEGATPLHVEGFDTTTLLTLSRAEKSKQLKAFFDEISENSMSEDDIENLDKQIQEAQRLFEVVQEFKKSVQTNSYALYIKEFYALYIELLNLNSENKYDINRLFSSYLQYIVSYIFDVFNTKEFKNEAKHIKELNDIYIKQLKKILDLYLKTMRVYKEWAVK